MNLIMGDTPTVSVFTAHGRQDLEGRSDERLIDLLIRTGVPWSAVSIYAVPREGGDPQLFPGLERTLGELSEFSDLLLYFNRNVNPFMFGLQSFKTVESADPAQEATEYLYQNLDNARSTSDVYLKKLSTDESKSVIADRVRDAIQATIPEGADLVVGVSGGGDSNALLYGLTQLEDYNLTIHPVIIKGIPDWDLGVPRASQLCDSYGLDLTVMEEPEVKQLLGMAEDSSSLIDRFEREFRGDDFEFLGTLLIRLALSKKAEEIGTSFICTGVNLEDILCEGLFRVSSGMKPAGFPARQIGETTLVYPLWLCPKRVIDGCFPKYSLDNYEARYPCFSLGRNLYYSVVYTLQSQYPGYVEQLTRGLSELSQQDPVVYSLDEQLGFYVERAVPLPLRHRFLRMIGQPT